MSSEIYVSTTSPTGETLCVYRLAGAAFRTVSGEGRLTDLYHAGVRHGGKRCLAALNACNDPELALAILKTAGSPEFTYELLTEADAARRPLRDHLCELEASLARRLALIPVLAEQAGYGGATTARPLPATRDPSSASPPPPALYLRLLHGRSDPAADLEDWGTQGPVIGPLTYVHTTYMCDVKFGAAVAVMERFFPEVMADWRGREIASANGPVCEWQFEILNDLIHYNGVFYGDWAMFAADVASSPVSTNGIEGDVA